MYQRSMIGIVLTFACGAAALGGCATIEPGFKYEFDGRVFRKDGVTPVKGAEVRLGRVDAPPPPDLPDKLSKDALKFMDKSTTKKTDTTGHYLGILQTVKGWKYTEFNGMHTGGPTQAPLPPVLNEVIVYVYDKRDKSQKAEQAEGEKLGKGGAWMGYRISVPPEAQTEAISGVRKIHVPDLLLPDKPTTMPATTEAAP